MRQLKTSLWCAFLIFFSWRAFASGSKPLLLLKPYDGKQNLVGWLMSEKLDGVRGVWDGSVLKTRRGNVIHAPKWFIKVLPPFALDGELWTKRSDFERIQSIVLKQKPDARWQSVTYQIFEVPKQSGGLQKRLSVLDTYLSQHPESRRVLKIISQQVVQSQKQVTDQLNQVILLGGEGLVVRQAHSAYRVGRSAQDLKVKKFSDDECVVTGYSPGKGKYTGMVGALLCQWQGKNIMLGTGLSNQQRQIPPKIGAQVTFKYTGLTKNGLPKFASFMRVRSVK